MTENEPELWIDRLREKHECFMHRNLVEKSIDVDGMNVTLRLPEYLSDLDICRSAISKDVLFVLARQPNQKSVSDECDAAILIGRLNEAGQYDIHVWHELYPWAIRYLGVELST